MGLAGAVGSMAKDPEGSVILTFAIGILILIFAISISKHSPANTPKKAVVLEDKAWRDSLKNSLDYTDTIIVLIKRNGHKRNTRDSL